jgi:predicted SAM-dependent methyltransferase
MKLRFIVGALIKNLRAADMRRAKKKQAAEAKEILKKYHQPFQLHVGCGKIYLDGWINIDLDSDTADMKLDVTEVLPFEDSSCELIYSEHMLEHLTVEQGVAFLKECLRVLKKDGVLRIAMPSLDRLIQRSCDGTWRDAEWLSWPQYRHVTTRAQMLNMAFREWGHQWLYDREEFHRRLSEAGFEKISDCDWGISQYIKLSGRESRQDSMLIMEAQK